MPCIGESRSSNPNVTKFQSVPLYTPLRYGQRIDRLSTGFSPLSCQIPLANMLRQRTTGNIPYQAINLASILCSYLSSTSARARSAPAQRECAFQTVTVNPAYGWTNLV